MSTKRTYQPSKLVRKRRHGFRARMATVGGRRVINNRRAKGRKILTAQISVSNSSYESIKLSSEFKRVTTSGVKFVTPFFIAFSLNLQNTQTKLGIIASRKVGGAVKRNRSKRVLRALFSENQQLLKNISIVLIARGSILNAKYEEIKKWMSNFMMKIKK